MDVCISVRNWCIGAVYRWILKPIFFRIDPEVVHDQMTSVGILLGRFSLSRFITRLCFGYNNSVLSQRVWGIHFENPTGLAAGFDKDGEMTDILPDVGFGFMEIGSITGLPCAGNSKPRLWRMPKSEGLLVYYGLKNKGAKHVASVLESKSFRIPLGISVAMTNCQANLDVSVAVDDYARAYEEFVRIGSYTTVNISCPNTSGGRPFMEPHNLEMLLSRLDAIPSKKPVCIKLSPDISLNQLDALLDVAKTHRVDGIICTNLTKNRNTGIIKDTGLPDVGGISGKPVAQLADEMIEHIYKREGKRFVIIGCGGIFSAEDAYRKIRKGATLVQMLTGMIYRGPQLVSEINRGLAVLLKKDGFSNISEAIGRDVV